VSFLTNIPVLWKTALLLTASNVFMTFAWYTTRNTCRVSQNHLPARKKRSASASSTCLKGISASSGKRFR
jgi:hypothetical protein